MKTLVTGSSGFIGRWLCRRLADEGHEVIGLDRRDAVTDSACSRHYTCDMLDANRLEAIVCGAQPDNVIHLAARVDLNETRAISGYATNIDGVRNLATAIRNAGSVGRVIYTSSQLVCSVGHIPKHMDEYCPNTLYGQSKVQTEQIVKETDGGGAVWCLVRPTTVWGPGMSPHYIRMAKLIKSRLYFHCGSGRLLKSYAYIANIAYQYSMLLAAEADLIQRKTFYLADYEPLSLRDYTNDLASAFGVRKIPTVPLPIAKMMALCGDAIERISRKPVPFNSFRLNNILTEYIFDLAPTRAICGSLPCSYRSGLGETASWLAAQMRPKMTGEA